MNLKAIWVPHLFKGLEESSSCTTRMMHLQTGHRGSQPDPRPESSSTNRPKAALLSFPLVAILLASAFPRTGIPRCLSSCHKPLRSPQPTLIR